MIRLVALLPVVLLSVTLQRDMFAQASTVPAQQRRQLGMAFTIGRDTSTIAAVAEGSAAEKAGIREGDPLISIAGIPAKALEAERIRAIADTAQSVDVVVVRGGEKLTIKVVPSPAVIRHPT